VDPALRRLACNAPLIEELERFEPQDACRVRGRPARNQGKKPAAGRSDKDFPPFSDNSEGIDVDLASALANKLRVKLELFWLQADENVEDDLRNAVLEGALHGRWCGRCHAARSG
jgi:hypothetical protein